MMLSPRAGRFVRSVARKLALGLSLLNAYGVETNTFGNPQYATGPLSGLL